MPADLSDLIYVCQMRVDHGDRASQAFVDAMQAVIRNGDDGMARRAERALQAISIETTADARISSGIVT